MKSLKKLCTPRKSVFNAKKRDTVLDISDLIGDKLSPDVFFEENYVTEGMKTLLEQGFRRLEGKSEQGEFLLKQAMGDGKTRNLLTLGLLAKHPENSKKVLGNIIQGGPETGRLLAKTRMHHPPARLPRACKMSPAWSIGPRTSPPPPCCRAWCGMIVCNFKIR